MDVGAKVVVKGLVQGVGFRYFVHRVAQRLGLTGVARNLYNGDVEVEVEGNRSLIEELIQELKIGPRAARVTDVRVEWKPYEKKFHGFEIR